MSEIELLKHILESSKIDHKNEILKKDSLKDACMYCKIHSLSGQMTGPLIENYIKYKYHMFKNDVKKCIGDLTLNNRNIEIKFSNGGKDHDKFNYVQLRMNHECEYILIAYYLDHKNINELGELFIFKLTKENIRDLILKYGGYAHGTVSHLGVITREDLYHIENDKEYSIRPKYNDRCWKELLLYRVEDI